MRSTLIILVALVTGCTQNPYFDHGETHVAELPDTGTVAGDLPPSERIFRPRISVSFTGPPVVEPDAGAGEADSYVGPDAGSDASGEYREDAASAESDSGVGEECVPGGEAPYGGGHLRLQVGQSLERVTDVNTECDSVTVETSARFEGAWADNEALPAEWDVRFGGHHFYVDLPTSGEPARCELDDEAFDCFTRNMIVPAPRQMVVRFEPGFLVLEQRDEYVGWNIGEGMGLAEVWQRLGYQPEDLEVYEIARIPLEENLGGDSLTSTLTAGGEPVGRGGVFLVYE